MDAKYSDLMEVKMSKPPSIFESLMTGWMNMMCSPWRSEINIDEKECNPMYDKIESTFIHKISNANYESLSAEEKNKLTLEYRMIGINDPDFIGYWLLMAKPPEQVLADTIDQEILKTIYKLAKEEEGPLSMDKEIEEEVRHQTGEMEGWVKGAQENGETKE